MKKADYINAKLNQLELLLYFIKHCETIAQKAKIEIEIRRIRFLLKHADSVELTEATIESRLNYEAYRKKIDTYDGSGCKRPGRRLSYSPSLARN